MIETNPDTDDFTRTDDAFVSVIGAAVVIVGILALIVAVAQLWMAFQRADDVRPVPVSHSTVMLSPERAGQPLTLGAWQYVVVEP